MGVLSNIRADLELSATELLDEYKERLMAEALCLCHNVAEAEDLVMRTFEVYFFKREQYDPRRGSLLVWLRAVMRNLQTDSLRKRKVPEVVMSPEDIERMIDVQIPATLQEDLEQAEADERLLSEAVKALSPKLREAVVLHYFESLPVAEVARALRVSENSIKNRLFYARKVLARRLRQKVGKHKKALAILGLLLLGATTLFGAYQTGLVDALRSLVGTTVPAASSLRGVVTADPLVSATRRDAAGTVRGAVTADPLVSATRRDAAGTVRGATTNTTSSKQQQEKTTVKLAPTLAAAALAVTTAVVTSEADGITLQVDQIKQRYPWNGLVDIDYTVVYDKDAKLGVDDNLEVEMVDNSVAPAVTNRAVSFLQAPLPLTEGKHRITWDAHADGVTSRSDHVKFVVKIAHYSAVYMVIDVSAGPGEDAVYPVDFLNGAPANKFKVDAYKGDKIVLRRIHPGSYIAGSPEDEASRNYTAAGEAQHRVAISRPFYVGIFEITQKQYLNVMGGENPSEIKDERHPVEKVSYNVIRGSADKSTHQYEWPWTDEVAASSFMGKLRAKCRSKGDDGTYSVPVAGFDLPTEFQWEYACRAGTTKAVNTTNDFDNTKSDKQVEQLRLMGRFVDNQDDGNGGSFSKHTTVGSYEPNAWGLYDMLGNVFETCLDWKRDDAVGLKQFVDPVGADSGTERVTRGGGWANAIHYCRSACRYGIAPGSGYSHIGFRLVRNLH